MKVFKWILRIILPLVVIGAGVGVMKRLTGSRPHAERTKPEARGALVEVQAVRRGARALQIVAYGNVVPAREVSLAAQVPGKVVSVNPELVRGGRLATGDRALGVERRDYTLAVSEAKARVAQAEHDLALEKGRREVAEREWKMLGSAREKGSLALREPQKVLAIARLEAAKAGLSRARLDLERTRLSAPFNALVVQESVEVGQVLGRGAPVAKLVGTDAFWVEVALPVADLAWLQIPGSEATVSGVGLEKPGRVLRLLGELERGGRMARVLVEVTDPLVGETPLLLGSYVKVSFAGREAKSVVEVPRVALREGDRVWLVDAEDRLEIRRVKVLRRLATSVLVESGLEGGDRLILSRLASPVPGMALRVKPGAGEPAAELPSGSKTR